MQFQAIMQFFLLFIYFFQGTEKDHNDELVVAAQRFLGQSLQKPCTRSQKVKSVGKQLNT